MTTTKTKVSGKIRLEKLIEKNHGKRIGIARLVKLTGLSEKSIYMYVSWNQIGKFRKGFLHVA